MDQDSMIRSARAVVFGSAYALFAMCAQLTAAPHASAQWLPDRAYTEGPGIRVGDLELHPGVAVRAGYDTNVFRVPDTQQYPALGSAILAVTPHLNLSTLTAQRRGGGEDAAGAAVAPPPPIAFNLGVAATYFHFFEDEAPSNAEVDFDTALSVLPERRLGFDVGASFTRNTRPFTIPVGGDRNDYAFDRARPSLTLRGQSRGGVLKGRLGFAPLVTFYEGEAFKYLNQVQYDIPAGLAWKFLPNTALLYDANLSINDYLDPDQERSSVFLSDGKRFQSRVGVNGAITPNLAARVLVGYAAVIQKAALLDDREDAVGEAVLTFAWSKKDNVEFGYQRQLEAANLGGWTQLDRGFLKSTMLFGGVFSLGLEGGVAHVNYGSLYHPNGDPLGVDAAGMPTVTEREDIRLDGGVHAEYRVINWLALLADFAALGTITDFEYFRGTGVPIYPGQFVSFQAYGGVRAHY